ncbi:transporter substrate-binding domain-containing protein [Marivirga harenae]|uniref:transporter substrate-binding domain-containing protein n=1 Tax=Marivirga harenae TaxID=2010992 RepID=UPI0026DF7B5C|nr:transporter substrate-binding domain-containing protein [Marivirga harenae]WKV11986.1 transporter substrate-binding domain-containing protein [Marivirga harenae]
MKHSRTLLLSIFIPLGLFGQSKSNNTFPEKSINYGIDKTYEPYEFVNKDGEAEGFNVDIVQAIAKELNWEISIYPYDWKIVRYKLEVTNELDASAYFKTAAREDSILFSRPISLVYYSIFTRSDKNPVEDLFSLSGKKVAIQEVTIVEEYFNQLGFLDLEQLQTYTSESAAIDAVVRGEADCAITSFMTTNYKMEAENISNIQSSSDPVFIAEYCFVVNKKESALLDSLNWGLRLVKASGEYDALYQKWLTPKKGWWEENIEIVIIIVAVFFLLAVMTLVYIYSLQKSVRKKSQLIKREIQNRTEAEWELRESENLRSKMEAFTSVMLVDINLEQSIIQAPKLFYSILGFDENELNGVNIHQLLSANSVVKDKEIKSILLNNEFSFLDAEYEFKTSSNVPVWMDSSTSLLYDINNKIVGFKQFLRDITPLKEANLNLKDLNAELANFMYKTSHDVRGPIANVLGLVNLGNLTTNDKEILSYFSMIEKSVHKLEHIFNDFREVSFILHGDLNITTFDVKELVEEVSIAIFLKRNKDIKRAKIDFELLSESKFITSDRALLKRLFYQLMENVFEHNSYYDTQLKITYEKYNSTHYKIYFEDDGIGIPEELHKKVFEVFFKGKRSDINVGMGLYMAKKVITRLNGELNLKSESGGGTTIEILFPVRQMTENITYN